MTTADLSEKEFNPYYGRYIYKLPETLHLREGFTKGASQVDNFFATLPSEKHLHRYADDKWTIKEVFQHLIDTERIFMYRCFRIARRDPAALANYNQEIYVAPSGANHKSMDQLLAEFEVGRDHSCTLLESLSDEDLAFVGAVGDNPMSARSAAFTIIGHDIWHMNIIKEKYL